jgi:hypothetical protein
MRLRAAFVVGMVLCVSSAHADPKKAQACASTLAPESKAIYDVSAADVAAGAEIKATLEAKTRALVMDGKVVRSSARSSAEAAGTCLKILKS